MISYIFILKNADDVSKFTNVFTKVLKEAVWIGVSAVPECESDLKSILGKSQVKYNLIINNENFSDYYKLDQFLPHLKNGWTYVHEIGDTFQDGVNEKIKKFISNNGKFAFITDGIEDINNTCFYNIIYKMLHGNKPEPDQIINFYHKVERESPNMIKKWKDVDL